MKVLLIQDVKTLGKKGDVVEVKTGYGLNYLFPQQLALLATPEALRGRERMLQEQSARETSERAQVEALQAKLNAQTFTLKTHAKDGKLFGSVGKKEIAKLLDVESRFVALEKPFREVGNFPVELDFGQGITAQVTVNIEAA